MRLNPLKPYNELPDLPPVADIEGKAILKKAIASRRASLFFITFSKLYKASYWHIAGN